MYVCMHESIFVTRRSYSLSSQECAPVGQTDVSSACYRIKKSVTVSVGSRSDGGREFHSFGAQAAKLVHIMYMYFHQQLL